MSRPLASPGRDACSAGAAGGLHPAAAAQPARRHALAALRAPLRAGSPSSCRADQVFHVSAAAGRRRMAIRLDWSIRDGYYLYRSRLKVSRRQWRHARARSSCPPGQIKMDPYFGREEIYRHAVTALLPVAGGSPRRARETLAAGDLPGLRGCRSLLSADHQDARRAPCRRRHRERPARRIGAQQCRLCPDGPRQPAISLRALARSGSLLAMIGWFYRRRASRLAFTPCVCPTVPILSGIIVGQGSKVTTARAFVLSLAYVLGMACTYTIAGIGVRGAGRPGAGARSRRPGSSRRSRRCSWRMALSMLGLFTVQMPSGTADAPRAAQQPADGRHRRRRRDHGRPLGAHRHHLRRAGAGRRAGGDQPDRPDGPRRRGAVRDEHRDGHAAAGRRAPRRASLLPKSGPWMDTVKQLFACSDAGCRRLDARPRGPGARHRGCSGRVPAATLAVVLWRGHPRAPAARWPLRIAGLAAALYGLVAGRRAPRWAAPIRWRPFPAWADTQPPLRFAPIDSRGRPGPRVAQASRAGRAGDARFLRGLVHLLQGNGSAPRSSIRRSAAHSRAWCCCAPMSRPTTRTTRHCSSASASSARRPSPSMAATAMSARAIAWSAS